MIGPAMMLAATGEFMTGDALYQLCGGRAERRADCVGYVSGVVDTMFAVSDPNDGTVLCLAKGVTRAQVAEEVQKYLKANGPENRQGPATRLVFIAVDAAYGCSKQDKP